MGGRDGSLSDIGQARKKRKGMCECSRGKVWLGCDGTTRCTGMMEKDARFGWVDQMNGRDRILVQARKQGRGMC